MAKFGSAVLLDLVSNSKESVSAVDQTRPPSRSLFDPRIDEDVPYSSEAWSSDGVGREGFRRDAKLSREL